MFYQSIINRLLKTNYFFLRDFAAKSKARLWLSVYASAVEETVKSLERVQRQTGDVVNTKNTKVVEKIDNRSVYAEVLLYTKLSFRRSSREICSRNVGINRLANISQFHNQ